MAVLLSCAFIFEGDRDSGSALDYADIQEICETADTEADDCCVSFEDGDVFEYPVQPYGEEFVLPEPADQTSEGVFCGWIGPDRLCRPGDLVVAEEFLSFTALRSDPDMGTVLALDNVRGGYSLSRSEGEMVLYSPYEGYEDGNMRIFSTAGQTNPKIHTRAGILLQSKRAAC